LKSYRKAHDSGRIQGLPLCKDCHVWGGDVELVREKQIIAGLCAEKITSPACQSFCKVDAGGTASLQQGGCEKGAAARRGEQL
jgi:hypothetical protein